MTTADALTVEHSFSGLGWRPRLEDGREALVLSQRLELPEILGRALAGRGIGVDEAEIFLNPSLKLQLPDPGHLKDMDGASARIADAVEAGEGIAIFGDYDVDGATSSALLMRFFRSLGVSATSYIPDRIKEGYGPNSKAMLGLGLAGAKVIITVDCGISAFEPLAAAKQAGIDVVVVDHHVAEARLPEALAVINPNRLDEESVHKQLAAVGVTFLLVIAVNRALRERGYYRDRPEPDLLQWLDLVALGTVCDQVRLTGINRALVAQGLKVLGGRANPGLVALADVARLESKPEAWHLGFMLGPRINAGGRVGQPDLGAKLLACDDPDAAAAMARELDGFNTERREIEAGVLDDALAQAEAATETGPGASNKDLIFVAGEGWHPGVIGIVASRIGERFHSPVCVVGIDGGIAKGSGRSVQGIDLGAAVIAARQEGLLINGGGHAMAAGFTVDRERLDELKAFLSARIAAQHAGGGEEIGPTLYHDGVIAAAGATTKLAESIQILAPFGQGNSEPRFVLPAVKIGKAQVVGENHLRLFVNGPDGGRIKAMAFRSADRPLGAALLNTGAMPVHLAGKLRIDNWGGRHDVQFLVDDAAPVA